MGSLDRIPVVDHCAVMGAVCHLRDDGCGGQDVHGHEVAPRDLVQE